MIRIQPGPMMNELGELEVAGLIRVDYRNEDAPEGGLLGWVDASSSWASMYLQATAQSR